MKIKGMNISSKLLISLAAIFLLTLLLGAVAWVQANSLWESTSGLYEHPLTVRRALGELNSNILIMHRDIKEIFLADDEQEIEGFVQDIAQREAYVYQQFDIVYQAYLGPRVDIDHAYASFAAWKPIREENIRRVREGRLDEAVACSKVTGPCGQHVAKMLAEIQDISDFANAKGNEFYQNAQTQRDTLMLRLGLLLGSLFFLMLGIAYVLVRGINDPLHDLTQMTERFSGGDFSARSGYVSGNEYGRLASAFNRMTAWIESEIQAKTRATDMTRVMLGEEEPRVFCQSLLKALLEQTHSQMGAVYLLNDPKTHFAHYESIGLNAAGRASFAVSEREGELGAALVSGKIQHTSLSESTRLTYSTVSGDWTPRELITIPILLGTEVLAVVSLASLQPYRPADLRLIHDLWHVLNARFNGVLAFRKIRHFSEKLEEQNRELTAQARELAVQADELNEQNIELEMQKKQLDEANRLKSAFLSNMSHELRTPLNSVIALSGVLGRRLKTLIPQEEYSYLDVIERNGRHLLSLINDILDISRIEAGREEITLSRFSVGALIEDVVEILQPQAQAKGVALRSSPEPDLPMITSDVEKCRHILQNLIGNAIKFTEQGKVDISVELRNGDIHIAVMDTGIGIPQDQIAFVFDEFHQVDGSASRRHDGTGLGLAIAKRYADMLHGKICIESEEGRGATFTLVLPLNHPGPVQREVETEISGPRASESRPRPVQAAPPTAAGAKILLVEDSEPACVQLCDILQPQGYQIEIARDGREALETITRFCPDAMILDLMMPEVDGFEVLRIIRGSEQCKSLPVLILTARHVTQDELAFLKGNHIFQLIQKGDIRREELLARVAQMVASTAAPALPEPVEGGISHASTASTSSAGVMASTASTASTSSATAATAATATGVATPLPEPVEGSMSKGAHASTSSATASKPLILIVEDNPDNLITARALLEADFNLLQASDGAAGIALARQQPPDLILMDVSLPAMDGIQTLKRMRSDETLSRIPVIAVTARAMKGDREEILAAGFDDYLSKPIDAELLKTKIEEWLRHG